jgi:CRP/FNR family transcriptional regulator, anaerobic regulatory protein
MVGVQENIRSEGPGSAHLGGRTQLALSEIEHTDIGKLGRSISVSPKTTVFKEGEPKTAVYKLTQGTAVHCRLRADGRKHIVGFALPGDLLNSPFADRHTCSVDVIGQATACQFPRRRFLTFLEAHPKALRALFETSAQEIDATYEHMLLLGRGTAEERFAEFIVRWRVRVGRKGALANVVPLPMSRRDVATYLGLTIETVSRLLAKLEREKVVRVIPEGLQLIGPTERPLLFERSYKAG